MGYTVRNTVETLYCHNCEWCPSLNPVCSLNETFIRTIFVCPWKMVSVSVRYLSYQPMDEKNKTCTLRFPAKQNPNMEKALFHWPIVLQYDVKAISRKFFGHEVFSAERSLNQPKARCVCIRSINQSNGFISVRFLFLFCSRVFISRSYENRSKRTPLLSGRKRG